MPTMDLLDVAIGVIFLYLLMSLVCSAVVELIEMMLQYRARDLEHGIRELLDDPSLVKAFYDHPLVTCLYKGTYKQPWDAGRIARWFEKWRPSKWKLPSYIPARSFALAVMDLLFSADGATAPLRDPAAAPPAIPLPDPPLPADAGRAVVAVDALVRAAAKDAVRARENVEEWFNSSMDRVSGWFKRRTQVILLLVGFFAAAWFNVDSIQVATALATSKDLRAVAVDAATKYVDSHTPPATTTDPAALKQTIADGTKAIGSLGLPLGWDDPTCGGNTPCDPKTAHFYQWRQLWDARTPASDFWTKLLGILITACAVSLGAPFWFDLLNKIIVVRSTVKPKEKSAVEGSKEPK